MKRLYKLTTAVLLFVMLLPFGTLHAAAYDVPDLPIFGLRGTIDGIDYQEMQSLDDKEMLQKYYGTEQPYQLFTYHYQSETGYTEPLEYLQNDPVYLVAPLTDTLKIILRSDLAESEARQQALQIIQKYFPNSKLQGSNRKYRIQVESETQRTPEQAEILMHALTQAGLITEFYTWGQTASYNQILHGFLTAYQPINPNGEPYDWGAVEEWVNTQHPNCKFICITDTDSSDAKSIGLDIDKHLTHNGHTIYAIVPPIETTFTERFALAAEIYEQFNLYANAYPSPYENAHELLGINALAVTGDINLDCSVDVADAVLLARFCAEDTMATITETGQKNADANSDSSITIEDVTAILRKIAKLD